MEWLINIYAHLTAKQIGFVLKLSRQSPFLARVLFRIFKVLRLFGRPIEKIAKQKAAQLKPAPNQVREGFFAVLAYLFKDATEEHCERLIETLRREGAAKIFSDMKWIFDERIVTEGEVLQFFVSRRFKPAEGPASEQPPMYECGNCHMKFRAPQGHEDFHEIVCPGCGRAWKRQELLLYAEEDED